MGGRARNRESHPYRFLFKLADGSNCWLNARGFPTIETLDSEDFTILAYPAPPEWAKVIVMYPVLPDPFVRSADAAGRALPDWAEPAAWNDPVTHIGPHTATQFYGGDLKGIEQHLERLGVTMLYLTPVVPARRNHRYDAHEWFQASHLKPGTPESAFYYWLDAEQRDYASWLGVTRLPKFNGNSPELRARFIEGPDSVVATWL